ncbi:MAG: hypothetical protein M1366_01375 [Patescibacteria group bacterium]|nr:hypothetical protein [Patescibacteria group bacterium]
MTVYLLILLLELLCAVLAAVIYWKDKKMEKIRKQFLAYLEKLDKENYRLKRLIYKRK